MSIVHVTPGLLDIRAITTFGLHAKPGTDTPIGKFGTGLKYAVAALVRRGYKVQLFVGPTEYEFYTVAGEFRGVDYNQVMMRKRRGILSKWRAEKLPFTTEHGKFWETWQAFRELHSNTLDEGGVTSTDDSVLSSSMEHLTVFRIEGEEYEKAYLDKDKIFLPEALKKREGDQSVQVFNSPSDHLYWRGIRVFDLEKPSIYTYNFLDDVTLTEDRTLKYLWDVQSKLAAYVARSKDPKFISSVVSADPEKFFEGRIDFDYAYVSPGQEFTDVVNKKRLRGSYVMPRALSYFDKYTPVVREKVSVRDQIAKWAYDTDLPKELTELLRYVLRCKIEEPSGDDNDIPF